MKRQAIRTAFSASMALTSLGSNEIANTPEGEAEAFKIILNDQGFEINEIEILRWCEFHFKRRYRFSTSPNWSPPPYIKPSTVVQHFRTYMENWYDQHRKLLRANSR